MADLSEIAESLVERDITKTEELTRAAIDANIPAQEILNKDVVAGMQVVGEQFGGGEIFLPELLMAGEAAKAAMKLLRPLLTKQEGVTGYTGKAAIGTVQGDVHDIGKNIVLMLLEANGWDVTDLGVDVAPEEFCTVVRENDFQVLGTHLTNAKTKFDDTEKRLDKFSGRLERIGGDQVEQLPEPGCQPLQTPPAA